MKLLETIALLLGRVCVSGYFLLNVVHQIINWHEVETDFIALIYNWNTYVSFSPTLQQIFQFILTWESPALMIGVIFEIVGAAFVLLGTKSKLGGWLLILYFLPMTIFVYHFWFLMGANEEIAFAHFMQNIAIVGGLFFIAAFGARKEKSDSFSIDVGSHDA
jgi:putative oxidoreductase